MGIYQLILRDYIKLSSIFAFVEQYIFELLKFFLYQYGKIHSF